MSIFWRRRCWQRMQVLRDKCCESKQLDYARRPLHHLVDEMFSLTIPFNLDILPAVGRDDCMVESKLFLIRLEKSENRRHEPQAIFVNIEPFSRNSQDQAMPLKLCRWMSCSSSLLVLDLRPMAFRVFPSAGIVYQICC